MTLDTHSGAGWSIRKWRRTDYPQVELIFRDCLSEFSWRGPERDELRRMRQTLVAADVYVAAEPAAGLVGFMSFEPVNAYVPHLFVAADWRFCGVASSLLAVARARAEGAVQLDVDCLNERAIAFYRSQGWSIRAPADRKSGVIRRGQIRLISPE
ncbi:MAG: GNAT family N-acetyltransferase [Pseudomonadota bacterium]